MRSIWVVMLVLFVIIVSNSCKNNSGDQGGQDDKNSTKNAEDSITDDAAYENCYEDFFKDLPRFQDSVSASLVLENKRKVTITRFFTDEFMSPVSQYGKKDLDGDAVSELVIYNNTGGAHCCDEFYIFSELKPNLFKFTGHISGGGTCVDPVTGIFTFSFTETLGYFFACYACAFNDTTGAFKTMRDIQLTYKKGKLLVIPYTAIEEQQNLTNLQILQNQGFEEVDGFMDNGWRKEFAMNFAVWHYNHGKNWNNTRKLFDKYYNFKDARPVWKEFYETLRAVAKENTF